MPVQISKFETMRRIRSKPISLIAIKKGLVGTAGRPTRGQSPATVIVLIACHISDNPDNTRLSSRSSFRRCHKRHKAGPPQLAAKFELWKIVPKQAFISTGPTPEIMIAHENQAHQRIEERCADEVCLGRNNGKDIARLENAVEKRPILNAVVER